MQNYNIYTDVRDAAWRFLIDNNVSRLPLSLSAICTKNNIVLLRDTENQYLRNNDRGATYLINGKYNIVLNGSDTVTVQRYTTAHELGHIFLKHPMMDGKYGRSFGIQREPKTPEEYQAERFAIDILAPACVLWGLKLHTAEEIAKLCNISITSAKFRAERMKELYKREQEFLQTKGHSCFLISELEKKVYEQFRLFIENMLFGDL